MPRVTTALLLIVMISQTYSSILGKSFSVIVILQFLVYYASPVGLGDSDQRIKLSKIRISSRPNLIVDYDPIQIPMTRSYQGSSFQSNFDLFFISFPSKDKKCKLKD